MVAYQRYRQPETKRAQDRPVLIFSWSPCSCCWPDLVRLYLAQQIAVPIKALAEGTRRISGGDLAHRVEVPPTAVGVLVGHSAT
jgi:hypothetical protein